MAGKILYPGAKSQYKSFFARYKKLLIATFIISLLAAFYIIVQYSAYWLVKNDEFKHVKYAIVLDGQGENMERSDFALKLLSEKKIDKIILSGSKRYKRLNSAEISRDEMLRQGDFDPNKILTIHHKEHSTFYEAQTIIPYLKARKIDTVLLITSSMASARVNQIFTKLGGSKITFLSTDMGYKDFIRPETWTTSRMGKKVWLKEMLKRKYTYWELLGMEEVNPVKGKSYKFNHELGGLSKDILMPIKPSVIDSINKADSIAVADSLKAVAKADSLEKDSIEKAVTDSLMKKDSLDQVSLDSSKSKSDSSKTKSDAKK